MSARPQLFTVTGDEEFSCQGTARIVEALARLVSESGSASLTVQRCKKDGTPFKRNAPIRIDARPFAVLRGLDVRCPSSLYLTNSDFNVLQRIRLEASRLYEATKSE